MQERTIKLVIAWASIITAAAIAQGPTATSDSDFGESVSRLEQLIFRQPRKGTAFDLWYRKYLESGRVNELVQSVERRVTTDPDDSVAQVVWGMLCEKLQRDEEAERAYANAAELDTLNYYPTYLRASLLERLGRQQLAAEALQAAIDLQPPPADYVRIAKQLGRLLLQLGRGEDAKSTWTQLVERFPREIRIITELANLLDEEGDFEEAIQYRRKALELTKDPFESLEEKVQIARLNAKAGRPHEAIRLFDETLDRVKPDSWRAREIRRYVEEVFLTSGDDQGLVTFWKKRQQRRPDEVETSLRLASALMQRGNVDASLRQLYAVLGKAPGRRDVREALIQQLGNAGRLDEVIDQCQQMVRRFPNDVDAWTRLGKMQLRLDSTSNEGVKNAVAAWEHIASIRSDDPSLALKVAELCRQAIPGVNSDESASAAERASRARSLRGKYGLLLESCERFYREAIRRAPDDLQFHEYLGEYLHALGREDEAAETWSEMVRGESAEQWHSLAELLSRYGYMDRANAAGERALERAPDSLEYLDHQSRRLMQSGDFDRALNLTSRLLSAAKTPEWRERAVQRRVAIASVAGRIENEIRELRKRMEEGRPTVDDYWLLSLLLEKQSRYVEAVKFMEQAVQLSSDEVVLIQKLAELQEKSGDVDGALDQLQRLTLLDAKNRTDYFKRIVDLQVNAKRFAQAEAAADQLVRLSPSLADGYRLQALIAARTRGTTSGLAALRRAVQLAPDDVSLRRQLAVILLESGARSEAANQFWQCFDLADTLSGKQTLLAWISQIDGSKEKQRIVSALKQRQRQPGRNDSTLAICAAQVLRDAGRYDAALNELEQAIKQYPDDIVVIREIVDLAQQSTQFGTAIRYQTILASKNPTPGNLTRLTHLHSVAGSSEDAFKIWEQFLDNSVDDARVVEAVSHQLSEGATGQAQRLAESGLARFPHSWELAYQLALVQFATGDDQPWSVKLFKDVICAEEATGGGNLKPVWHRPLGSGVTPAPEIELLQNAREAYLFMRDVPESLKSASVDTRYVPGWVRSAQPKTLLEAKLRCAVGLMISRAKRVSSNQYDGPPRPSKRTHFEHSTGSEDDRTAEFPVSRNLTAGDEIETELDGDMALYAVLAEYGAHPWLGKQQIGRRLEQLPEENAALKHTLRLLLPSFDHVALKPTDSSDRQDVVKRIMSSYRWVEENRPDLQREVLLPLACHLIVLGEDQLALGLIRREIDRLETHKPSQRLLWVAEQLGDRAIKRRLLTRIAQLLAESGPAGMREIELRSISDAAFNLSDESRRNDDITSLITLVEHTLARSQLASGPDGQVSRDDSIAYCVSDSYLDEVWKQGLSAYQASDNEGWKSTASLAMARDAISARLSFLQLRSRGLTSAIQPAKSDADPLEFPNTNVYLDKFRLSLLEKLAARLESNESRQVALDILDRRWKEFANPDRFTYASAYFSLAWLLDDKRKSLSILERLCVQHPDDAHLRLSLVQALFNGGQLKEALAQVDQLGQLAATPPTDLNRLRDEIAARWSQIAKVRDLEGQGGVVRDVAFSPDGKLLASASVDRSIRLWNVADGRMDAVLQGHTDMALCLAFAPDGRRLVSSGYDRSILIWDIAKAELIGSLDGHTDVVRALAFSPDGESLASSGDEREVFIWDFEAGATHRILSGHTETVTSLSYSADGQFLAAGSIDGTVRVWNTSDPNKPAQFFSRPGAVNAVCFAPHGSTLAVAGEDRHVYLLDVVTGKTVNSFRVSTSGIRSIKYSPDGQTLLVGCTDGTLKLLDARAGQVRFDLRSGAGAIQPVVAFSPSGEFLASAGYDGAVRLWMANPSQTLLRARTGDR